MTTLAVLVLTLALAPADAPRAELRGDTDARAVQTAVAASIVGLVSPPPRGTTCREIPLASVYTAANPEEAREKGAYNEQRATSLNDASGSLWSGLVFPRPGSPGSGPAGMRSQDRHRLSHDDCWNCERRRVQG